MQKEKKKEFSKELLNFNFNSSIRKRFKFFIRDVFNFTDKYMIIKLNIMLNNACSSFRSYCLNDLIPKFKNLFIKS